jgi:hypothetical protein
MEERKKTEEERMKAEAEKKKAEAEKKKAEAEKKKAEAEKKKAEEMKLKYVRGMLSNNMPADVIMDITGLSSEELMGIAKGA